MNGCALEVGGEQKEAAAGVGPSPERDGPEEGVMRMPDGPERLLDKLWRASLTVLGAVLALYFSVKLLLQIWPVLLIAVGVVAGAIILIRWLRWRFW